MSPAEWEQRLSDLGRVATPVRRWPGREWWRFAIDAATYRLHFYPADARGARPGTAAKEYAALQTLQRLKLPALRPVLLLSRFKFDGRIGDAVVIADDRGTGFQPVFSASQTRVRNPRHDECDAHPHAVRDGIVRILTALNAAGLGHADLRPDAFVVTPGGVRLADAASLVQGGVTREHLMRFAHAAGERATRADRLRAWRAIVDADAVPPRDRRVLRRFRRDVGRLAVGRVRVGGWSGQFLAAVDAAPWSAASGLAVTADDWRREWPVLLDAMRAGRLDVLKSDPSGDVLAGRATLGGAGVDVILKRSRNKSLLRRVADPRRSRARRTWTKALALLVRGVPTERPLAVFERRVVGYAVESVVVFARVPGVTLEHADLDALSPADRDTLFRRCGRTLRRIDDTRLAHTDAKSSNWIVFSDAAAGPIPVLVDLYGVRPMNPWLGLFGLHRLLRAMKNHPQYTPADSLAICQGFAPFTSPQAEPDSAAGASDAH